MKVYVVERGCYSDRGVVGVYISPEAAITANPPKARVYADHKPTDYNQYYSRLRPGGWKELDYVGMPARRWSNGLNGDDLMDITEYEVEGEA